LLVLWSRSLANNRSAHCALANEVINRNDLDVNRFLPKQGDMQGARVLILTGTYKDEQGVCLGESDRAGLWTVSPDDGVEILSLSFEKDFGLLVDLSANPQRN